MITARPMKPTIKPPVRHYAYFRHSLNVVLSQKNERKHMGCESQRFAASFWYSLPSFSLKTNRSSSSVEQNMRKHF